MRNINDLCICTVIVLALLTLSGCKDDSSTTPEVEKDSPTPITRIHDERTFTPAEDISFISLSEAEIDYEIESAVYFGTYAGLQGDAIYAVEIPNNWNGGGLIMWAHGYAGTGEELKVSTPPLGWRAAVLDAGYAWAASSYSANYYDVRAGIEDTNKLALELTDYLERDWSVSFNKPVQYLISGVSMGGHITAAAIDRENKEQTLFPVNYEGASPMCQAEQNQFQWLGDYPRVMLELAGYEQEDFPNIQTLIGNYSPYGTIAIAGELITSLFTTNENGSPDWTSPINENGERLISIAQQLTGGERPIFEQGFSTYWNDIALSAAGGDGTISGILAKNIYDNTNSIYRWTTDEIPNQEELDFNDAITRVVADEGVNPLRDDGVRWIPIVNGEFDIPVLTLHTLGDFYVPFIHQQLYKQRAVNNGNDEFLVQRAIRATGHCEFSPEEYYQTITDLVSWVNTGIKPLGDEILDKSVVTHDIYGCQFTNPERTELPACSL